MQIFCTVSKHLHHIANAKPTANHADLLAYVHSALTSHWLWFFSHFVNMHFKTSWCFRNDAFTLRQSRSNHFSQAIFSSSLNQIIFGFCFCFCFQWIQCEAMLWLLLRISLIILLMCYTINHLCYAYKFWVDISSWFWKNRTND